MHEQLIPPTMVRVEFKKLPMLRCGMQGVVVVGLGRRMHWRARQAGGKVRRSKSPPSNVKDSYKLLVFALQEHSGTTCSVICLENKSKLLRGLARASKTNSSIVQDQILNQNIRSNTTRGEAEGVLLFYAMVEVKNEAEPTSPCGNLEQGSSLRPLLLSSPLAIP